MVCFDVNCTYFNLLRDNYLIWIIKPKEEPIECVAVLFKIALKQNSNNEDSFSKNEFQIENVFHF